MSEVNREIAKVERVDLGFEDHGMFGFNIAFVGGGWGQGTGYWCLATSQEDTPGVDSRIIARIIRSFGVSDWRQIVGRTVWIEHAHDQIFAWENLPTESGFRFVIRDEFARVRP